MSQETKDNAEAEGILTSSESKDCETIEKENCANNESKQEIQTKKELHDSTDNILNVEKQEEPSDLKETVNHLTITNDVTKENEKNALSENSKNDTCLENKINSTNRVSRLKVSGFLEIVNLDENESMENMLGASFLPTDLKLMKIAGRKRLDNYAATRAPSVLPLQMSGTGIPLVKNSKTTNSLTHMQQTNHRNTSKTSQVGKDGYESLLTKKPYVSSYKMTTFEKIESENAKKQLHERLKKQMNLSKGVPKSSDFTKNPSVSNVKMNAVPTKKENIAADTLKSKESINKKKEKIEPIKTKTLNRQISLEFHRWPSGEARKSSFTEAPTKQLSKISTVSPKPPEASLAKTEMNTTLHSRSSSLRVQSRKSSRKPIQKKPFYLQSLLTTKKATEKKDLPEQNLGHKSFIASTLENNIMHQIHSFQDSMHSVGRRTSSRHDVLTSLKHSESSNKTPLSEAHFLLKNSYLTKKTEEVELLKKKKHSIQMPKLNVKKLGFSSPASAPSSGRLNHVSISKVSPLHSISKEDKNRYHIQLKKKKHGKQKDTMSIFGQSGKFSNNSKQETFMKNKRDLYLENRRLPNIHFTPSERNLGALNKALLSLQTKTGKNEEIAFQPKRVHSDTSTFFIMKEHPCLTILHQEGDGLDSYIHVAHKDSLSKENGSVMQKEPNSLQANDASLSEKSICRRCGSSILRKNNNTKQTHSDTYQNDLKEDSVSTRSKRKRDPHTCRYSDTMHQQSVTASQLANGSFPPLTSPEFKINIQLRKSGEAAVRSTQVYPKYTPSLRLPQFLYKDEVNWSRTPLVQKDEAHIVDPNTFNRKNGKKSMDKAFGNSTGSHALETPVSSVNICQRCCFNSVKPC